SSFPLSSVFPYTTLFRSGVTPFGGRHRVDDRFHLLELLFRLGLGGFHLRGIDLAHHRQFIHHRAQPAHATHLLQLITEIFQIERSEEHTSELQSRENLV